MLATTLRLVIAAATVIAAAACGDPSSTIDAAGPIDAAADDGPADARVDAAPPICNPTRPSGQTGCAPGTRCTWVVVQEVPTRAGMLGCVPPGTVPLGGACTLGPPGAGTGHDDCVEGAICVDGACEDICSFSGGSGNCSTSTTCVMTAGVFGNPGEVPIAGACRRGCDAVGQTDCPPDQGCYVLVSALTSRTVCAAAGVLGQGQEIPGQVFANSCRRGYQPRRRDQTTQVMECGALCRPTDVTMGQNMASEGGVAPATCAARNAAPPNDPANGESCRFWWAREPTVGSPYSNTVGWCFRHAAFQYDATGDGVLDTPHPRCINVTTGDVLPPIDDPPTSDAEYFWCVALPFLLQREQPAPPTLVLDRLAPP